MNKPLSIAYRDYKQAIVDITNNSGLPAFLIAPVMRDLFEEVTNASRMEYETQKRQYEEMLAQQN